MRKYINKLLCSMITTILIISTILMISTPVFADESKNEADKTKPEEVTKVGKSELDNLLDPNSPNYDPGLRYGGDGTRFGQPGNRTPDPGFKKLSEQKDWTYHNAWGTGLRSDSGASQTIASQKVDTYLNLSDADDWLYAPTLLPSDYAPLEAVVVYNGSPTQRS